MPSHIDDGGAGVGAPVPLQFLSPQGPVEYVDMGNGPAVLALHGGAGGYDQGLILLQATLATAPPLRRIAVSRPGYLGTPLETGRSPAEQADAYAALLDHLGIETAFIAAVSAGGPSALEFALRHPARCAALILISTCTGQLAVPQEVKSRLPFMQFLARHPWLVALLRWQARRNPRKSGLRSVRDRELLDRTLAHPQAGPLMRALQDSAFTRLGERLPGTLNDMARFECLPEMPLANIRAPVFILHGTDDRIVPFGHAERVVTAVSGAELMAIEGGEHVSLFTHLDETRIGVRRFIERCLRSGNE